VSRPAAAEEVPDFGWNCLRIDFFYDVYRLIVLEGNEIDRLEILAHWESILLSCFVLHLLQFAPTSLLHLLEGVVFALSICFLEGESGVFFEFAHPTS
jgi:hypothetical protein